MRRRYTVEARGESLPYRHKEPTVALLDRVTSRRPSLFGGLFTIVGGNVVWRLVCEVGILLSSIHETLVSSDKTVG